MANSLLTLAQITREAFRLWRGTNIFLQRMEAERGQYDAEGAQVGSTLRIRMPEGFASNFAGPSLLGLSEAHERSMELLRSWLSPAQREQFARCNYFEVRGGSSGVIYRLHPKYSFGIVPQSGRYARTALCVVPEGALAIGDIMLAQKIGLETNERATLRCANVYG